MSGLLLGENGRNIVLHIHGTGGNFYYNSHFLRPLSEKLNNFGWDVLTVNSSGADIYEVWKGYRAIGAAAEIFEDCISDINAWIKFILDKGYKNIVFEGHSLGTEKVVYYMNKGEYKDKVKAVILLGFADSYGTHYQYLKEKGTDYLDEAKKMIKDGKGEYLLSDIYAHAGYLPQTAKLYISFFTPNSELSKALPLRNDANLAMFNKIKVPILGIIGDTGEFTIIPIKKCIENLKKANPLIRVYQIPNCDHEYNSKEKEVAEVINLFLKEI